MRPLNLKNLVIVGNRGTHKEFTLSVVEGLCVDSRDKEGLFAVPVMPAHGSHKDALDQWVEFCWSRGVYLYPGAVVSWAYPCPGGCGTYNGTVQRVTGTGVVVQFSRKNGARVEKTVKFVEITGTRKGNAKPPYWTLGRLPFQQRRTTRRQVTMEQNIKAGDKVFFGRANGEKTLGVFVKVNSKTIKVRQLESRGTFKAYAVGSVWNVARSLVTLAPQGATTAPPPATEPSAPKAPRSEAEVKREILGLYCQLSPENLSCDGELSYAQVRRRASALNARLKACFRELGREVSEEEAYGTL